MKNVLESSRRMCRKRKLKSFVFKLGIILFFGAGFAGFLYIEPLLVRSVVVEGNENISRKDVMAKIDSILSRKYLSVIPFDNIFLFPAGAAALELKSEFPRVKSAEIKRSLIDKKITVNLTERKMAAVWCEENDSEADEAAVFAKECALLDEEGVIFARAPSFSGLTLFKIYDGRNKDVSLGESALPEKITRDILLFRDLAEQNLGKKFVSARMNSDSVVELKSAEGWKAILNDNSDFKEAFGNLKIAFDSEIKDRKNLDYVDLRFGNKVFYKFK